MFTARPQDLSRRRPPPPSPHPTLPQFRPTEFVDHVAERQICQIISILFPELLKVVADSEHHDARTRGRATTIFSKLAYALIVYGQRDEEVGVGGWFWHRTETR